MSRSCFNCMYFDSCPLLPKNKWEEDEFIDISGKCLNFEKTV